ncbi:uncharacterized protein LOC103391007 [Cynoglossus semilaevis]|uniref:uncharacterized protein LOC103391007 n=1 Tax=Cynoglossus semilaevis TaxID=244447 RepID=UPI0007DCA351|nr:uncharacterized protein LOC103391007 [Cynoglossus semilaevis]
MAAVNMDASVTCEETEPVKVGVVFPTKPENKDCVISEDGRTLIYTSAKNRETQTFSFDQVVNVDNVQSFHSELLPSVTDSVSRGLIVSLLVCGVCSEEMCILIDHSIIKQLLADLFSRLLSRVKEEPFISVSFIQFYPDGSAVDLLSPERQTLKPVTHPVLGRLIEGVCEVCVATAEDACDLYETGRKTLRTRARDVYGRCSSLFSVAVEWKLHGETGEEKEKEEEEEEVCRSRLQLFSLAGRASRTDLRGVNPLVTVLEELPHVAPSAERFLPGLLHEALTGNSKTFLIYCFNPQGILDVETPTALALAQKVRCLTTRATVGRWCPRATETESRQKIMDLQAVMMSLGESDVDHTHRLAELNQNLQMVKNQSWERRREESKRLKKKCLTPPHSSVPSREGRAESHRLKCLQDQLRVEMERHIRGNVV